MSSKFTASIEAILDTSLVDKQIKDIGNNHKIVLSNLQFDKQSLIAGIESALSGHKFSIEIGNINTQNVKNQLSESGAAAGKAFSQSFDQSTRAAQKFEGSVRQAQTAFNNGAIEASIEKMAAGYERLGNTGHERLEAIKADIEELRILHAEMGQATSQDQLVQAYERFNTVLDRTKNNLSTVSSVSKQYASANDVVALQNKMEAWLNSNTRASKKFGTTMQDLIARTQNMSKQGRVLRSDLEGVATSFKQVDLAASAMGLKGQSFVTSLGNVFKTVTKFIGSYRLIYSAINTVKQGIKDIIDLDTALVDLKKTTNATDSQLQNFYYSANDTAKALGTTTKEVIQAAAEWSRLGLT